MNAIPILGWALSLLFTASTAVPFWIIWTVCGIGEKFFYFVPDVYKQIGFWESVGLFMVVGIIKQVFVPKVASVVNTNNK
jgi:hypothetical protein